MKKPLIVLFVLSVVVICLLLLARVFAPTNVWLIGIIAMIYCWTPGFVTLFFAKKEKVAIPLFKKPNKTFYLIPLYSISIALFAFLLTIPFGSLRAVNPIFINQSSSKIIGLVILLFFTSYLLLTLFLGFLFFGGELFWRGYCLAKLRSKGILKAIWITALIWTLWIYLWLAFFLHSPGLDSLFLKFLFIPLMTFSLAPVLTYIRLKCHSILSTSVFYGSVISALAYFFVLFPQTPVFGTGFLIFGYVLFSLIFKLYSRTTWDNLNKLP